MTKKKGLLDFLSENTFIHILMSIILGFLVGAIFLAVMGLSVGAAYGRLINSVTTLKGFSYVIGYSVPYTPASTGRTTLVVPFQHTVVVIGYDANSVTIQDGGMKYTRDWNTFLVSWGALGNRAVYVM